MNRLRRSILVLMPLCAFFAPRSVSAQHNCVDGLDPAGRPCRPAPPVVRRTSPVVRRTPPRFAAPIPPAVPTASATLVINLVDAQGQAFVGDPCLEVDGVRVSSRSWVLTPGESHTLVSCDDDLVVTGERVNGPFSLNPGVTTDVLSVRPRTYAVAVRLPTTIARSAVQLIEARREGNAAVRFRPLTNAYAAALRSGPWTVHVEVTDAPPYDHEITVERGPLHVELPLPPRRGTLHVHFASERLRVSATTDGGPPVAAGAAEGTAVPARYVVDLPEVEVRATPHRVELVSGGEAFASRDVIMTGDNDTVDFGLVCAPGRESVAPIENPAETHCCWLGQIWHHSQRHCAGVPTRCPEGTRRTYDGCVADCPGGQVGVVDGATNAVVCCWPGQEAIRGACFGPCPSGRTRLGAECVSDAVMWHDGGTLMLGGGLGLGPGGGRFEAFASVFAQIPYALLVGARFHALLEGGRTHRIWVGGSVPLFSYNRADLYARSLVNLSLGASATMYVDDLANPLLGVHIMYLMHVTCGISLMAMAEWTDPAGTFEGRESYFSGSIGLQANMARSLCSR